MLPTRNHTAKLPPWTLRSALPSPFPLKTLPGPLCWGPKMCCLTVNPPPLATPRGPTAGACGSSKSYSLNAATTLHTESHQTVSWLHSNQQGVKLNVLMKSRRQNHLFFSAPITDWTAWHFTTQLYFPFFFFFYLSKYFQQSSQSLCVFFSSSSSGY